MKLTDFSLSVPRGIRLAERFAPACSGKWVLFHVSCNLCLLFVFTNRSIVIVSVRFHWQASVGISAMHTIFIALILLLKKSQHDLWFITRVGLEWRAQRTRRSSVFVGVITKTYLFETAVPFDNHRIIFMVAIDIFDEMRTGKLPFMAIHRTHIIIIIIIVMIITLLLPVDSDRFQTSEFGSAKLKD